MKPCSSTEKREFSVSTFSYLECGHYPLVLLSDDPRFSLEKNTFYSLLKNLVSRCRPPMTQSLLDSSIEMEFLLSDESPYFSHYACKMLMLFKS